MRRAQLPILVLAGSIAAQEPPSGRWDFEDSLDLAAPAAGRPLSLTKSVQSAEGPSAHDRALRIPPGAGIAIAHGLASPVNSYTISLDLRLPTNGAWRSLLQTNPRNSDDGDCFVRPDGAVGVRATGYSAPSVFAGTWHRLVLSVDGGRSHRIYLDGRRILDGAPQPMDGRFSLGDTLLLFADDDGETDVVELARATIHGRALDSAEVAALGGFAESSLLPLVRPPWLQAATDTSMSILWETADDRDSHLEFARKSSPSTWTESVAATPSPGDRIRIARLGGLAAGTTYSYRIVSGSARSEIRTFRTAPSDRSSRVRLGIWGDSHRLHPAREMLAYMVDSLGVDVAATTGDISNDGNDPSDLSAVFAPLVLEGVGSRVPFFAALGNHDVGGYSAPRIRRYLDQVRDRNSDPEAKGGSYVVGWGPVAMVFLDWNRLESDIPEWLAGQLESEFVNSFPYVFVFLHRTPFYERWQAEGEDAVLRETYPPVVEGHGVQASFSGHMHGYERGFRNGTFYCTNGGSSYLDEGEPVGKDYPFIDVGAFEALPANFGLVNELVTVDADPTRAIARMHAFDADGRSLGVLDSFVMRPRSIGLAPRSRPALPRIVLEGSRLVARMDPSRTGRVQMRILDLRGRALGMESTGDGETRLELRPLASGCWIAQARGPGGRLERSFCIP